MVVCRKKPMGLFKFLLYGTVALAVVGYLFYNNRVEKTEKKPVHSAVALPLSAKPSRLKSTPSSAYKEALRQYAEDNFLILAMVDQAWIDMTLNFYETSLEPYGIKNYLMVSLGGTTCDTLSSYGIHCITYANDTNTGKDTQYGTPTSSMKMYYRSMFIHDALQEGYRVLITDVDAIFLADVRPELCCKEVDIHIMWDSVEYAAGFAVYYGEDAIWMYKQLALHLLKQPNHVEQSVMNSLFKTLKKKSRLNSFSVMDKSKVFAGVDYYEKPKRFFADLAVPCESCLVIQNNWIVSYAAKIYRFKEMLQWVYDGPDRYFSDPSRKYLSYDGDMSDRKDPFWDLQKNALITALAIGHVLKRVVILPRFKGAKGDTLYPLNSFIFIKHFDAQFQGLYRESSFLLHPKVPDSVKQNQTSVVQITNLTWSSNEDTIKIEQKEIEKRLSKYSGVSILKLGSLVDVEVLLNPSEEKVFRAKTSKAFKKAPYRQYGA